MYSPKVTDRAIQAASDAQIQQQRAKNQPVWALERHTSAQIAHAISALNAVWDAELGEQTRPLRPDETQFITNERRICKLDYRYFTSRYCYIVDWRQQRAPFIPNVAQSIIRDVWGEMEEAGNAIWMQQLKARRLGVSTETQLGLLHRFQFYQHTAAVTAAATPKNSVALAGMLKFAYNNQPWWLKPAPTKIANDLPVEFGELHSTLSIQAGNQFTGVARGSTPTVIHLSELAEWQDAELLVDAALMRAVIDHPLIFGIMESTALGTGNWWHQTWVRHKREFAEGRARVRPVFLPWYVGTDIYPSPAALQARPIPANWVPLDRTIHHAERARQYVLSDPLLFKYLAKSDRRWQMPRAQMWYYELEYDNAKKAKELNLFLGEMASDDFSCFQSTNTPVIDQEILLNYHERTREPLAVYTIVGPEIPEALVVSRRQWDFDQPVINISASSVLTNFHGVYQLIPVKFEGWPTFDPNGKLLIWEHPSDDHTYGIGTDTSGGTGSDNAVMEVLREATPERPPGQVAEFVHDRMTSFQFWPVAMALHLYYSTYSMKLGRRAQSRAAIECMGTGEVVQYELQKRGWSNFHPWKRYDNKQPTADGDTRKIGIYTNVWFRPQMLDMVITCLDEEAIEIWSPYLVQELTTLEREPGVQKIKAAYGAHDDRVFGLGFPLYSLHMGKPPHKQHQRKRLPYVGEDQSSQVTHPTWRAPSQMIAASGAPSQALHPAGGLVRYVNHQLPEGFK